MVTIVGAGPSGLFTAYKLLEAGINVELYEQMPSAGRKFLVAGKSGLNLTFEKSGFDLKTAYYEHADLFESIFENFSNTDLRSWADSFGCETFVGSSGRVFPKEFKAAELLKSWMDSLKAYNGFSFFSKHKMIALDGDTVHFETDGRIIKQKYDYLVLALGGGSWSRTGSDGEWQGTLENLSLKIIPFRSSNCGFNIKGFEQESRFPIKYVSASLAEHHFKGDIMLTEWGIEGTPVYHLTHYIQDTFLGSEEVIISIDLKPDVLEVDIKNALKTGSKSIGHKLKSKLKLSEEAILFLKRFTTKEEFQNKEVLAQKIKNLEITLSSPRDLDEAISTRGGLDMDELNRDMSLKKYPKIYLSGEMLDWDAPTGGFLLQACFSQAAFVAKSIINISR